MSLPGRRVLLAVPADLKRAADHGPRRLLRTAPPAASLAGARPGHRSAGRAPAPMPWSRTSWPACGSRAAGQAAEARAARPRARRPGWRRPGGTPRRRRGRRPARRRRHHRGARGRARCAARARSRPPLTDLVTRLVEDGAAELAVVGPRAPVEVVRPDDGPGVVDDAHLGVDVDRRALGVLEGVDGDPVARRPAGASQARDAADQVRRPGQPAVLVREPGDDRDQAQLGLVAQGARPARRRPRSTTGTGPRGRSSERARGSAFR